MKKSALELSKLDKDDTNITVPDIFDKYAAREGMDDVCLANFAAQRQRVNLQMGKSSTMTEKSHESFDTFVIQWTKIKPTFSESNAYCFFRGEMKRLTFSSRIVPPCIMKIKTK